MKTAMPTLLRVKDVMTDAVVFLRANHTVEEAWHALHARSINGAPVLDERGRLAGVLSQSDLADPRHFADPGGDPNRPVAPRLVHHAMTHVVYAVRAEDPVMSAVRLMLQEHIHRALVVNDEGSIAGIVVPMDVLRALAAGKFGESLAEEGEPVQFVDLRNFPPRG